MVRGLTRRIDPRESITGKLVTAGIATTAVAALVITVAVWRVSTGIVTTYAEAQAVFRGGLLAIAVVTAGNVAALALLQRSIVGGLRNLDRETRMVVEREMSEASFETDRNDEIGQLHWSRGTRQPAFGAGRDCRIAQPRPRDDSDGADADADRLPTG